MFGMHRYFRKSLGYVLFQRNCHSQVAKTAVRAVSDVKSENTKMTPDETVTRTVIKKKSLVSAAFSNLRQADAAENESANINERIINSKTVNDLLSVESLQITREHALQIVSILSNWCSINKIKVTDFETDPRFIKLCSFLGKKEGNQQTNSQTQKKGKATDKIKHQTEDLKVVLNVAGDDEAAKIIADLDIPQVIKVMTNLANKKRRSNPLLHAVAYNINQSNHQLNLKQIADLLYSMAILNFPDTTLIDRICRDLQAILLQNKNTAVVGSILNSFGHLRYRDTTTLELLADWILQNFQNCRLKDITALFYTLGTLNYPTSQIEFLMEKGLEEELFPTAVDWCDYVYSLVLLNTATEKHLDSVLKREFVKKLLGETKGYLPVPMKIKLLNINGYAQLVLNGYKGALLEKDSFKSDVSLSYNEQKQKQISGMLNTLKRLVPLETHVRTNVMTNYGFIIDAECCFDAKGNPVEYEKANNACKRVAVLVHDYHDMCKGIHASISGKDNLSITLLEKMGYHVLSLPYTEFNIQDKILKRVQYLEGKLKNITKQEGKSK